MKPCRQKKWLVRQNHLRDWRNRIWDGAGIPDGKKTYIDWHIEFFVNFYNKPNSEISLILDVGCGYMLQNFRQASRIHELLELLGGRYVGIDPIEEWFEPGVGTNNEVNFVKGLGEALPFADGGFDFVLCLGVLDHAMRPNRVLQEIHRVLKTGGNLWLANAFIEGPLPRVFGEKIRHRVGLDESHLFVWTPDNLATMVENSGFRIRKTARCIVTTSFFINALRE